MNGTARALFVKHLRAQGEWCSQNPSSPVIIPIITWNSQILNISTKNCAAQLSLNLASRPSCSWKSIEHCHSLRTWITAITMDGIKFGSLTDLLGLIFMPSIRMLTHACVWPQWVAVNDILFGLSTLLCMRRGDSEAMTSQWSNLGALFYHGPLTR